MSGTGRDRPEAPFKAVTPLGRRAIVAETMRAELPNSRRQNRSGAVLAPEAVVAGQRPDSASLQGRRVLPHRLGEPGHLFGMPGSEARRPHLVVLEKPRGVLPGVEHGKAPGLGLNRLGGVVGQERHAHGHHQPQLSSTLRSSSQLPGSNGVGSPSLPPFRSQVRRASSRDTAGRRLIRVGRIPQ